jgi:O-antigen ligase
MQIWAELGLVGALLAFAIFVLTIRSIRRQPHLVMSASLALTAGAAAVALVGHGAWQGWWAAALGAAVTWMLAARTTLLEKGHEPVRR